jgi:Icc protein
MTRLLCASGLLLWTGLPLFADAPTNPSGVTARIALISDLHIQRATNDTMVLAHKRLHRAIADINAAKVDLVLAAGDLTEYGRPHELSAFRDHILGFDAPVWFVPGNHDVGGKIIGGKTKSDSITAWRLRFYESRLGRSFFVRTHAGVRVIGLNSALMGSGLGREKKMWEMLEKELAKPSGQPTIMVTHYLPFYKTPDEPGGEYWNIEPTPRQRLLPLLQTGGVKTVLSGHLHTQRVNREKGILYVTTPPVSYGLPQGKQPEGWMLITVPREGETQIDFHRLDVTAR